MKYALAYDSRKPAILFAVKTDWLLEVLGSQFGAIIIGAFEAADPENLFQQNYETGFGFGGVMKPMAEKNPVCPDSFSQYRLDLPVLREEDPSESCVAYHLDDHSNCHYCNGTGHAFVENTAAANNIGKTLSAVTCAIHMFGENKPLCGPEEGVLQGMIPMAEQSMEVVLGFRTNPQMENAIRLWMSPDAFDAFFVAGTMSRFAPIKEAEEAIISALTQMRAGTRSDVRADVKIEKSHLYFDIDSECGLVQAHSPQLLPGQPMEYFAHDLRNTDNTLAMMAGIAAMYPVLTAAEQAVRCVKHHR